MRLDADGNYPYATDVIALTAAAAGLAPLRPPAAWFGKQEANEPTPLTITDDGQVYGHIALWDSCHTGTAGVCFTPPRSPSGYSYFHLGEIECEDGTKLPCGQLTFHANHAPLSLNPDKTRDHYANTGLVGAEVRAHDGRHGIWVTGAVRPDLTAEQARALAASKPSGDWRTLRRGGPLELMGVLAVNIPGYPVPRSRALIAAGTPLDEEPRLALVASCSMPELSEREARDRIDVLAARFEDDPAAALCDLIAV